MTVNQSSISGTAGGKGHADVRLDSELGVRCDSPLGELLLFGILHISLEMSRQRKKDWKQREETLVHMTSYVTRCFSSANAGDDVVKNASVVVHLLHMQCELLDFSKLL